MVAEFSESGVSFQYPSTWTAEREELDDGWTVTVQSPGTAFFMLCLRSDAPDCSELAQQTIKDLSEVYPDLESEPVAASIAGQPAIGHDIRFFSFDLTNSCWTRCVDAVEGTVLLMWQCSDLDLEQYEPALRAIVASLQIE